MNSKKTLDEDLFATNKTLREEVLVGRAMLRWGSTQKVKAR